MIEAMRLKRLSAAMLATSALVFGGSVLAGQGRAQPAKPVTFICSAADKQFITTVSTNLTQLSYWSDALVSHDVELSVVAQQAKSEAVQVGQTRPQDRTLRATQGLLGSMFVEYSKAVSATAQGRSGDKHMMTSWRLAHAVHDLLLGAKGGLGAQGCDVSPLLIS
jgi:transposase-like protein